MSEPANVGIQMQTPTIIIKPAEPKKEEPKEEKKPEANKE